MFWIQLWDIELSEHLQFIMILIIPCAAAHAHEQMCWVSGHQQRHTIGRDGEKWDSSSLSLSTPSALFFRLTSSMPRSSDGHVDEVGGKNVFASPAPLWCRDGMLNSLLLQGLSAAYGRRTLHVSWKHMARSRKIGIFIFADLRRERKAVYTYFWRHWLFRKTGASLVYKSHRE